MITRELGRTGLKVGEVGLGCEGFIGKTEEEIEQLLTAAVKDGVNYMDLYTPDPDLRSKLGTVLKKLGNPIMLQAHLCTLWRDDQYKWTRDPDEVKESFEDLLARLQRDFVEVGMIHYLDTMEDWKTVSEGPVLAYALEQKAKRRIGHIGVSSHNPRVALTAVESGLVDVLMFSVNPCYDLQPADEDCEALWDGKSYEKPLVNMDPEREVLYEACNRLGVGITVMKAFGGGDLLSETLSPAGKALTVNQCIHYALTRPAVATVLAGAHTMEQLQASLAYETAADWEKDYAEAFASFPKISWEGHCMYCGHCAPCPMGINVASVTKFLNLAKAQGQVPETVREHYAALPHNAKDCVECGSCEGRCPFSVSVIENMQEAVKIFK